MILNFDAAVGSRTGKVRGNNEDNYYFFGRILPLEHTDVATVHRKLKFTLTEKNSNGFALAVFDGMGGTENGQTAAYLSARRFKRCLENHAPELSIRECLTDAIGKMNADVRSFSRKNKYSCGTTAVILCLLDDRFYVCNVGDSRAYLLRDGVLIQLSEDHTDAETLKKFGITDQKPHLSQYIGIDEEGEELIPFFSEGTLQDGDTFLICSDGLTDMVDTERMGALMQSSADAKACAELLLQAAMDGGGRDNTTLGCVRVTVS